MKIQRRQKAEYTKTLKIIEKKNKCEEVRKKKVEDVRKAGKTKMRREMMTVRKKVT